MCVSLSAGTQFSYAQNEVSAPSQEASSGITAEDLLQIQDSEDRTYTLDELSEDEYDGFIYKIDEDISRSDLRDMNSEIKKLDGEESIEKLSADGLYRADSLEVIDEVISADNLEYVEPNYRFELFDYSVAPDDEYYDDQEWVFDAMNVDYAWGKGLYGSYKGRTARVAVIDTGVSQHPDLKNVMKGTGFINGEETFDSDDMDFHGTFVAGIIGAESNNSRGVTGLMPAVEIYPINVFQRLKTKTYADSDDITLAINDAVKHNADVINMSLGSVYRSRTMEYAIKSATAKGVILVAAAGNDGNSIYNYPAAFDDVVAVGSVDSDMDLAYYSNTNDQVTVAAPGDGIISTIPEDIQRQGVISKGYMKGDGTSFAAPQVSALAAMAKTIRPDLTSDEFHAMLKKTSEDYGAFGYDTSYGWGIVNFAAVTGELLTCTGGHSFGDWELRTKPGFDSNGVKSRVCDTCSLRENKSLSGLKSAKMDKTTFVYDGNVHLPEVLSFTDSTGATRSDVTYRLRYDDRYSDEIGTYKCTVSLYGDYQGKKTYTYKIIPKTVSQRTPSAKKGGVLVKWSLPSEIERDQIDGYQISYSKYKSFSSYSTIKVKNPDAASYNIKKLSSGRKYYVKVRAYKGSIYSNWSKVLYAKTR